MSHFNERPAPGRALVDLAHEILDLTEDRDHWRREALHYKGLFEMMQQAQRDSIKSSEGLICDIFKAALDPDSGINRMQRAIERDPLKGAQT